MSFQQRSKKEFRFEQLEDRALLCGATTSSSSTTSSLAKGIAAAAAAVKNSAPAAIAKTPPSSGASSISSDRVLSATKLTATITDPTGANSATGTALYEQKSGCGKSYTELAVSVTGAAADTTFDVNLVQTAGDGTVTKTLVGTITTDDSGNGTLTASSKADSTKGEVALPDGFPTVKAGDSIAIGTDLTGALATATTTGDGHHHGDLTVSRVAAKLSDSTGADSTVAYVSYTTITHNGVTTNVFSVWVKNGTPGATLDVKLAGSDTSVGTITVDANGRGHLIFATNAKGVFAQTFPDGFPAVTDQTTISVGSLTGVLATVATPLTHKHV